MAAAEWGLTTKFALLQGAHAQGYSNQAHAQGYSNRTPAGLRPRPRPRPCLRPGVQSSQQPRLFPARFFINDGRIPSCPWGPIAGSRGFFLFPAHAKRVVHRYFSLPLDETTRWPFFQQPRLVAMTKRIAVDANMAAPQAEMTPNSPDYGHPKQKIAPFA